MLLSRQKESFLQSGEFCVISDSMEQQKGNFFFTSSPWSFYDSISIQITVWEVSRIVSKMLPEPNQASRTPSQYADLSRKLFLFSFFSKPFTARLSEIFVNSEENPFMIRFIAGAHLHGLHNRKRRKRRKYSLKLNGLTGRHAFRCSFTKI